MALAKRIIPCLDVTAGRVVKGVNFLELRDAGDPVEIARRYDDQGADELTFLDITATSDQRDLILPIIEAVASQVFIPLTVGGGVRAVEDVRRLLNAGADKVSINSAAVANPQLVRDASASTARSASSSRSTRSACLPTAKPPRWEVFTHGGRKPTGLDAVEWARKMAELGAGEILLTSMDRDGTKSGFDLALTRAVSDAVAIPVIASGGVGRLQHLADGIMEGHADAVLAASIFHYGEYTVGEAKRFMADQGISVRIVTCDESAEAAGSTRCKWDANGLVPVIAQEASHRRRADVRVDEPRGAGEDRRNRRARCTSRARASACGSRARSPGHVQQVHEVRLDCDEDVVLLKVEQVSGIACHTGRHSCFFQKFEGIGGRRRLGRRRAGAERPRTHLQMTQPTPSTQDTLLRLAAIIDSRKGGDPERSRTFRACSTKATTRFSRRSAKKPPKSCWPRKTRATAVRRRRWSAKWPICGFIVS